MTDRAYEPSDADPFEQIARTGNAAAADTDADDPFAKIAKLGGQAPPEQSSVTGAFVRGAERGALPAVGSLPAIGAGAEVGAELGLLGGPAAPVTVPAGTIIGGAAGGLLASSALSKVQDWALSKLPDSWREKIGLSDRQEQLDQGEHPIASFLGGIAPYALTMRPGAAPKTPLPENATALQRILAHPMTSRLFGGAAMGGIELGQEKTEGEPTNWAKVAISTGFGMVFNRPTKIGETLTEAGARPARALLGRPEPTVAQAADAKVMGPGVTEQVFQGAHDQDPAAAMTAQDGARQEAATIGQPQAAQDLHATARQMQPEAFALYDDLVEREKMLTTWIAENPSEDMPAAQQHLAATRASIAEITPEIAAAYRRAAEVTGAETVAPAEKRFATMAEMLASQGQPPGEAPPAGTLPPNELVPPRTIEQQRDFIRNDVTQQLIAAGRPLEEAQAAGALVAARYETRAARFGGALGTAEDLYRREGPQIKGAAPAAATPTPAAPAPAAEKAPIPAAAEEGPVKTIDLSPRGPRGPAARDPNTFSLLEFIASRGGIRSDDPLITDLRQSFGGKNKFVPGFGQLIRDPKQLSTAARQGGRSAPMSLDHALKAAIEAGYIQDRGETTGGVTTKTISDLLEAVDEEARGNRRYRLGHEREEKSTEQEQFEHDHKALLDELDEHLKTSGGQPLTAAEKSRAAELYFQEGIHETPEILERLFLEADNAGIEQGGEPRDEAIPGWDIPYEHAAIAGEGTAAATGRPEQPGGGAGAGGGERAGEGADFESEYFQRKPGELFQQPVTAPPFYSQVARTIDNAKQEKASPEQWAAFLKNQPGIKSEEMQWLGLDDWLKEQTGPVTKQQIADYVRANEIEVTEVAKGGERPKNWTVTTAGAPMGADFTTEAFESREAAELEWARRHRLQPEAFHSVSELPTRTSMPKFQQYTLPGGENYRELLLTLPPKEKEFNALTFDAIAKRLGYGGWTSSLTEAQKAHIERIYDQQAMKPIELTRRMTEIEDQLNNPNLSQEERGALRQQYKDLADITREQPTFKSSHWDEPNVLAHIRFDDRVTDGKKTLHVAEVQSDWHQAGRKKGYREGAPDTAGWRAELKQHGNNSYFSVFDAEGRHLENIHLANTEEEAIKRAAEHTQAAGVPDAPFKTTWPELALKRMIRYAAENGYDRVTWDTGETNAARYDLSKRISRVAYVNDTLSAWDHNDNQVLSRSDVKPEQLPGYIGKEASEKLLAQEPKPVPQLANVFPDEISIEQTEHQYIARNKDGRQVEIGKGTVGTEEEARDYAARYLNKKANEINLARINAYGKIGPTYELKGVDLKVGGEGMLGFYDDILPKAANKLVKKFGGKVETTKVDTGQPIANIEIPDDVRAALRSIDNLGFDSSGKALGALRQDMREGRDIHKAWDLDQPQDAEAVRTIEDYLHNTMKRESAHSIDITPQLRDAATTQGFPLFQKALGSVKQDTQGIYRIITLSQKADASTFVHETGHMFLEELMRDAAHEKAPDALKADAQTVKGWLGIESVDDLKTRHHEKFARGFEQYLREGVAPSPDLAGVFAKFRDWLLRLYQSLKGLGSEISPDIRNVFDRLLASEPQRTVIAPDLVKRPTLQDIHESDANLTEPHEAEPAMDRVMAEAERFGAQLPPELTAEHGTAAARIEPAAGAEPAAEAGIGPGQPGQVVEGGGRSAAEPAGSAGGAQHGAELPGGGAARPEGAGVPAAAGEGAGAARPDAALSDQPLAPRPAALLGPEQSDLVDKAGNIRLENLTNVEDVRDAIRQAARENNDFVGDRRGVVTDGQVMDLAADLGMEGAERLVKERVIGQAFNAEQVVALRKLLIQSATEVSAAMKKAAAGTDQDVMAYAVAKDRHQMIQATVAQATAEAGRALRAFRNIAGTEEAQQADLFIRQATGKTLYQLRREAQLGATLDTPQKISKFTNDANKPTFGRMLMEYWINGLISGPATHVTYSIGNQILALQKAGPETAAAALLGAARKAMGRQGETVRLGEVAAQLGGARRGYLPAAKAAMEALRTGVTTLLPGESELQGTLPLQVGSEFAKPAILDEAATLHDVMTATFSILQGIKDGFRASGALAESAPRIGLRQSPLGSIPDIELGGVNALPVGTLARLPSRFIAAIHSFYRSINYSMEKAAIAYRTAANEGLSGQAFDARVADIHQNPSEQVMERSRGVATELTLMGQGGEFTKALSRLTNTPIFGLPIFKFIDPFVHISSNIIEQSIIERTPVGILSPEIRADLMGKNGTVAQDTALARMLVGTAYAVGIGGLAAEGYVSGSGPSDPRQAAIWRLAGNQAHSVRVGDIWYDVHRLGPMGMLMGIAADLYDVAHKASQGDLLNAASVLQHAITQNILDESFMRGPSDLIKAVDDPGRYGESYIRNWLSSFVPYSVGMAQIARASDPYSRQARSVMDAIKQKVPGLSEELLPRRDIWGEPMPSRDALLAPGVTAIYETRMSRDPVNLALLNLGIAPGYLPRKIRNIDLTDDQYDDFQRIAGRMTKMRLDAIVRSPDFAMWPSHIRHDVIAEVITQSREAARGLMLAKYPQIVRDATAARLKKLQD